METPLFNSDIPVIDGRATPWREPALGLLALKKNFLIILPDLPEEVECLKKVTHYEPAPLPREDIRALRELVSRESYIRLQAAVDHGDRVFLIETLKMPLVRPPQVKKYAVACDLRGIFAESDSFAEAKEACQRFGLELNRRTGYSVLRIHEWSGKEWVPLRVPC